MIQPRLFAHMESGEEVAAMDVHDDLGQVFAVAEWVRREGGDPTSPLSLSALDCAFVLRRFDGSPGTVKVGHTVALHDDGFRVHSAARFHEFFTEVV